MSHTGTREHYYPKLELIETEFLLRVATVMTAGEAKYGRFNWRNFNEDQIDDICRHGVMHFMAYLNGDRSEDHLANAACNAMMRMWYDSRPIEVGSEACTNEYASHEDVSEAVPETPYSVPEGHTVYLAGPIDAVPDDESRSWRVMVARKLELCGVSSYSPKHAFSIVAPTPHISDWVQSINDMAVAMCDSMIAYLPSDTLTVGTVFEIALARSRNKRIVIVCDAPILTFADVLQVKTFEAAVEAIRLWVGVVDPQ